MKKLITMDDVRQRKNNSKCNVIYVNSNTLITPGAKDLASELGIEIKRGSEEEQICLEAEGDKEMSVEQIVKDKLQGIDITEDTISHIIQEVVKAIAATGAAVPQIKKECDPSGIRLVRGESVVLDRFDTGIATDKVGIKEILDIRECPNMATGFMEIEKTSFDWTLGYDELDYIVEGNMDITVDGKTYRGHAGDVFFIPMNTSITFSSPDYCKFFFSTYPANWQELSGK